MDEIEVVSSFFAERSSDKECPGGVPNKDTDTTISDDFLSLIDNLNSRLSSFSVPQPVHCIYNSTEYAKYPFEMYVRKYCNTKKQIMYFGMNPGPWGMSQTGVPFGEVNMVRNWLGIEGPVSKPNPELSARPVNGFRCTRSEISGKRFWGLFKNICGTPETFFKTSFVYNYLPQQWMKSNGCNVTPNDFKASDMKELYDICDPTFIRVIQLYEINTIVAIGKFCELRAKKAIAKYVSNSNIKIYYLPHPSPRTVNNNDWDKKALECIQNMNLMQHYQQNENSSNT